MKRNNITMYAENLADHLVTSMFDITARYTMHNEFNGKDEFTEDENLTVEMFANDYSGWMVTYITIEKGTLVVGLIPPQ